MKKQERDFMEELISVIIPVYNAEEYLPRCINSIIDQTYFNIEIILVDDGSNDRSGHMCDEYARKDARIKVIHQQNRGVSEARNKGLAIARGELIAFIDSDDYIDKDYLKILYNNIDNCDIISCNFKIIYSNDTTKRDYKMQYNTQIKTSNNELFSDCINSMIYTYVIWGKLYRRKIIGNIRFKKQAYSEDALFIREVFLNCENVKLIPYNGYNYFIGEQNVTEDKKRAAEKLSGILKMLLSTWEFCVENKIDINYNKLEKKIINTIEGILKYSLKHRKKIVSNTIEDINNCLPIIRKCKNIAYIKKIIIIYAIKIANIVDRYKRKI